MINSIIGSGIFGVPGELNRLLGAASPWACVLAGLAISVVIACFVEVGSQFTESGGPYLYVRTAFGRLLGIQVAWFTALTPMAAAAAQANLFASYLEAFFPATGAPGAHVLVIIAVLTVPLLANLAGVHAGKQLSGVLVVAKLAPLLLLILAGLLLPWNATAPPPPAAARDAALWSSAVLIAMFSFGGFENALAATGAVRDPRRSIPFSLMLSLTVCIGINTLIQWVTAAALGGAAGTSGSGSSIVTPVSSSL